jgi:hypothetical protein
MTQISTTLDDDPDITWEKPGIEAGWRLITFDDGSWSELDLEGYRGVLFAAPGQDVTELLARADERMTEEMPSSRRIFGPDDWRITDESPF